MKEQNLYPHQFKIDQKARIASNGHPAFLIWFTGLSGSGKSTLAEQMESLLHQKGYHTYLLDGDNVRKGLNGDLGFSEDDRIENIRRIGEVANLMVDAGLIVLASFISPFNSDRNKIKEMLGASSYFEAYVECSLEECERRDVKGLYKLARAGKIANFTGISSPYETPENPDIILNTESNKSEVLVAKLWEKISTRFALNP
jgi:adenylylsulfate kinase